MHEGNDMVRLILADDEPIITRGIQKLIDFPALGAKVVGEYEDGKSAMDGILRLKPDLALLDISMPGMGGIEVLKKIRELALATKVIFVSGFQDFEYAKAAIKYGAVDYLLKPVIKDELLKAIEKATDDIRGEMKTVQQSDGEEQDAYEKCSKLGKKGYIPVIAEVLFEDAMSEQSAKLIRFSFNSFLSEYLESQNLGIVFSKDGNTVLVLNGIDENEAEIILRTLRDEAEAFLNKKLFFVVGEYVEEMSEIPAAYRQCHLYLCYDYFADHITGGIIRVKDAQKTGESYVSEYDEIEKKIIASVVSMNATDLHLYCNKMTKLIYKMSAGKREDACFYICSVVHHVDERVREILGDSKQRSMSELLNAARSCGSYRELTDVFFDYLEGDFRALAEMAENSDKNVMNAARAYINEHYAENVNLSILAKVVHMNPYYFSAFFKKNCGINFKDYVSKIRVEHAIPLLVSTDKKIYEIATSIGFSDARTFSDAFQKIYRETPNEYRKRIKEI